jgi:hypothetical protein
MSGLYAEIWDLSKTLVHRDGSPNKVEIAKALGTSEKTVRRTLSRSEITDPEILTAAAAGGIEDPRNLAHFWKISKDGEGNGYSLFVKNPHTGQNVNYYDMVREAVGSVPLAPLKTLPPLKMAKNSNLLVVDLADVHFLKLSVKSETGVTYDRQVARHRVVEGTKALLKKSSGMNIGRILFALGNDILHIDGPRSTTTSGTFQDTDGTIFQGFNDAGTALDEAINECAEVAPVDLIHCMSNHDWTHGWALSQVVAARATRNKRVRATPYNLSEMHRKYYRFEKNLLGFTHGDGAKEEKLYGLMVKDAREHISECQNLYWYLHHVHHKVRKTRGEFEFLREKDHNGMTAMISGTPRIEGEGVNIEYVRSPSAPDSWHDRNGYCNRQGVECFVHHPVDGQDARFTQWF